MRYMYKTKSVQERMVIVDTLISKYQPPEDDIIGLLNGIDTEKDWNDYPFVAFNSDIDVINLNPGYDYCLNNHTLIDTIEEFSRICGIVTEISYEDFTITKHRFI